MGRLMHTVVKGGDHVQVQVHLKAVVNDDVHQDDHDDVNVDAELPDQL
jgi:hypothetical protein